MDLQDDPRPVHRARRRLLAGRHPAVTALVGLALTGNAGASTGGEGAPRGTAGASEGVSVPGTAAPGAAAAGASAPDQPGGDPSGGARAFDPWAATLAVFPGVVVHGLGHYALGDPRTGALLLGAEGAGLGLLALGIGGLAVTGASRRSVTPLVLTSVAGGGLFFGSWLLDLYGAWVPPGARGVAARVEPWFVARVGVVHVEDRVFSYENLADTALLVRLGPWGVGAEALTGLDEPHQRWRGTLAHRLSGARADGRVPARDGSSLDLVAEYVHHAYARDGFTVRTGAAWVTGRLELGRITPGLRGAFVEGDVGWGLQDFDYNLPGVPSDPADFLVARHGVGAWVGDPAGVHGEVVLDYDHRHDGLAAGLKVPGLGSGVMGHPGVSTRLWLTPLLGFEAGLEVGSAWVMAGSVLLREDGR